RSVRHVVEAFRHEVVVGVVIGATADELDGIRPEDLVVIDGPHLAERRDLFAGVDRHAAEIVSKAGARDGRAGAAFVGERAGIARVAPWPGPLVDARLLRPLALRARLGGARRGPAVLSRTAAELQNRKKQARPEKPKHRARSTTAAV